MKRAIEFKRGYEHNRERVLKSVKFNRSCLNCNYFFQAVGDKSECCQNRNVSKYDMTVTENNAYCIYWTPIKDKNTTLFKKSGRSILD